jgi:hypothetical protein
MSFVSTAHTGEAQRMMSVRMARRNCMVLSF